MWWTNLGSITSCCSGKESALLFGRTLGDWTRDYGGNQIKANSFDRILIFPSIIFSCGENGGRGGFTC